MVLYKKYERIFSSNSGRNRQRIEDMKITELIKFLEEVKEKHGDIEVVVQYRDSGGSYYGTDTDIYCEVENETVIL